MIYLVDHPFKTISISGQKKCRVGTPISAIRESKFGTMKLTFRSLDEGFGETALQTKSQEKSWR